MALSREEIEEIARAVARRVVPAFKPCLCGLAMWKAHGHTDYLEEAISARNHDQLRAASRDMDKELDAIDEACSVNTTRAKGRLNDLVEVGQRGDWDQASRNFVELRVLTREPLEEAVAEKVEA
ncbi:hypothetical protein ES703_113624 [subsurface metagenome]